MYRIANLESCILYIHSTDIGTEYFKYGVYTPFFPLQNTGGIAFWIAEHRIFEIGAVLDVSEDDSVIEVRNFY